MAALGWNAATRLDRARLGSEVWGDSRCVGIDERGRSHGFATFGSGARVVRRASRGLRRCAWVLSVFHRCQRRPRGVVGRSGRSGLRAVLRRGDADARRQAFRAFDSFCSLSGWIEGD